jgi:hypothetical protein
MATKMTADGKTKAKVLIVKVTRPQKSRKVRKADNQKKAARKAQRGVLPGPTPKKGPIAAGVERTRSSLANAPPSEAKHAFHVANRRRVPLTTARGADPAGVQGLGDVPQ